MKIIFNFLVLSFCVITGNLFCFELTAQGLIPTSETEYNEFTSWNPESESLDRDIDFEQSAADLKIKLEKYSTFSLREYCPAVLNQGVFNNCVGWVVSYFAMSTQLNYKLKITDNDLKYLLALDPSQLSFETSKYKDNWQFESTNFPTALNYLKKNGVPFRINTSTENLEESNKGKKVKISKWDKIDFKVNLNKTIKSAVLSGKPVVFGCPLSDDFYVGGCITTDGIVKEIKSEFIGYQAMCIIGYNDSLNGGVYEVVTSYGDGFGVDGFIYLPYELFDKVVNQGFVFNVEVPHNFYNEKTQEFNLGYFVFENKTDVNLNVIIHNADTLYVGGFKKDKKFGMGAQITKENILLYEKYPKIFDYEQNLNVLSSFEEFVSMISMIYSFKESSSSSSIHKLEQNDVIPKTINKSPVFPGGEIELNKFISSNFVYPYSSNIRRKDGYVNVTFIVDTDGTIIDAKIEKGLDIEINNEVLRVIKIMPKWIPGEKNGIASKDRVTISVDCRPPLKK